MDDLWKGSPLEVLVRANEISRGPLLPVRLGSVRLSIGAPIVLLLAVQRPQWSVASGILGIGLWWWTVLPWALLPLMVIGASGLGSIAAFTKSDGGLVVTIMGLVVLVGVIGGHNFAAPRYSLPAMLPIAVLIFRQNLRPISPLVMGLVGPLCWAVLHDWCGASAAMSKPQRAWQRR